MIVKSLAMLTLFLVSCMSTNDKKPQHSITTEEPKIVFHLVSIDKYQKPVWPEKTPEGKFKISFNALHDAKIEYITSIEFIDGKFKLSLLQTHPQYHKLRVYFDRLEKDKDLQKIISMYSVPSHYKWDIYHRISSDLEDTGYFFISEKLYDKLQKEKRTILQDEEPKDIRSDIYVVVRM